ncbi:MAG TPA: methyltransferase domain-containing protein [Chitinophagaceae bacterium]|nr:methyltransferase domain-containing protein [Chitinophagaceae bacterium]
MPQITWNADLYNSKHSFVSKYGEDLIGWLQPQAGEKILDLGCGTGSLADEITNYGAEVTGIDNSPEMVAKAKAAYPHIHFGVRDATGFAFTEKFDAVFSNAVLHWINEPAKVIACVYDALTPGGRFVMEMGGKNNVKSITAAVKKAMVEEGLEDKLAGDFWYFPSVAQYIALLEAQGFTVRQVLYFDRDTELTGEDGMANWIEMFWPFFFKHISQQQVQAVTAKAVEYLRPGYYRNGKWYADYVRLRVKAIKN